MQCQVVVGEISMIASRAYFLVISSSHTLYLGVLFHCGRSGIRCLGSCSGSVSGVTVGTGCGLCRQRRSFKMEITGYLRFHLPHLCSKYVLEPDVRLVSFVISCLFLLFICVCFSFFSIWRISNCQYMHAMHACLFYHFTFISLCHHSHYSFYLFVLFTIVFLFWLLFCFFYLYLMIVLHYELMKGTRILCNIACTTRLFACL